MRDARKKAEPFVLAVTLLMTLDPDWTWGAKPVATTSPSHSALCLLQTLFDVGTVSGLSDRQLLEQFVTRRSHEAAEAAFWALVERHGPMVLRTCRGVLRDPHAAQDAFQATFLVLVSRAGSLWVQDSLGPWLHEVALRVAFRARGAAARRRTHERRWAELAAARSPRDEDRDGLEPELHEEIGRLPKRLRAAVVLCYFEGLTCEEAARRLGWPVGTVKSRLGRARDRLRSRMTRRGLVPGAGILIAPQPFEVMRLPASLTQATTSAALGIGAGRPATIHLVAAPVAGLVRGALRTMFWTRLKIAVAAAMVAVLGWGIIGHRVSRAHDLENQVEDEANRRGLRPETEGRAPHSALPVLVAPREVAAHAGRGAILVYALDGRTNRIVEHPKGRRRPTEEIAYKEVALDLRWVVVTGLLDHRALRQSLADSDKVAFEVAHPDYRRIDVQRQESQPGGGWSDWTPVDRDPTCLILDNLPEESAERTPQQVRLEALVDPLPYLKTGSWRGVDVERLVAQRAEDVQAPKPRYDRRLYNFPTTEAPEIMVRSLDFTVEPSRSYRYRVRIVIEGRACGGRRTEWIGPWSRPSPEVVTPRD
jgi:RNA polymerase sigma factor (sigma-70 family)